MDQNCTNQEKIHVDIPLALCIVGHQNSKELSILSCTYNCKIVEKRKSQKKKKISLLWFTYIISEVFNCLVFSKALSKLRINVKPCLSLENDKNQHKALLTDGTNLYCAYTKFPIHIIFELNCYV